MKVIPLLVLSIIFFHCKLYAQTDSVSIKTRTALADARKFKKTKAIRQAHRKRLLLNTSDYFKPTELSASDPKLLSDSIYVQAYKDAAYRKSVYGSIGHIHYAPDLSTAHIVKVVVASTVVVIATVYFISFIGKNLVF